MEEEEGRTKETSGTTHAQVSMADNANNSSCDIILKTMRNGWKEHERM